MRPPVPYFGGKQTIAADIVRTFPDHDHYVEPFGGSLAVLLAKEQKHMETVNDDDGYLMTFWRVLRDFPEELERVCALTPHSRAELIAADLAEQELGDLELARRVFVQLTQGRAGTLRSTGWRFHIDPRGSTTSIPKYLTGYLARIAPVADRLQHVSLECRPGLEVIESYGRHPRVLMYVDPPYVGELRSAGSYRKEMSAEEDHRALADALRRCVSAVVISGYAASLYDEELYADWWRMELRTGTGQGSVWSERTEVLWSNRPFSNHIRQESLWEAVS